MTIHQPIDKVRAYAARAHRLLVDGQWRDAVSGKAFDVFNPANGERIAAVAHGEAADVDLAVQAARRSFEQRVWAGLTADDRSLVLLRYADLVEGHAEEIAQIDVLDNGMPEAFAKAMVAAAVGWVRFFSGSTTRVFGKTMSGAMSGGGQDFHAYTLREPIGVAGLILPWNGPSAIFLVKVATALAASCSVVVKPAESTPLSALLLGELALEAGVPPGVLNVVTGYGDAGQAIVDHPDVNKISFTGSTTTGKKIVQSAAGNLKRLSLELGGKSPCIIFDDANLDLAIPAAAMAIFRNTGQICYAGSRLFVQRKSYDRVVAGISEIAESIRVGDGFDPQSELGPVVSERQHKRVSDYIDLGKEEGAEIVAGGAPISRAGYFVQPTVFANVNNAMRIVREEIFGPVLVATPFDEFEDVVRYANDTKYGLGSGVFTGDVNKAHRMATRIEAGNVWVNCYGINHVTMPFGGYKESGWGRELTDEGLDAFLETKSVVIQLQ